MLAVAHRGGNELTALREAVALHADVVELDVHLRRGRLEVGHEKSLGPLPWLYDKGHLYPAHPRPTLDDVLDAAPAGTLLMLDLKGMGRVASRTQRLLHQRGHDRPVWLCARWWPSARRFSREPWARVLLSARNRGELARLRRALTTQPPHGVSVHLSLLTPRIVAEIQSYGVTVLSWPIDDDEALARAQEVGIDGAITKDLDIVRQLVTSS